MEHLLTPSQAAERLGVRVSTLYTWVHRRQVPYQKVGRALRFSPRALAVWLGGQAHDAEPEQGRPSDLKQVGLRP